MEFARMLSSILLKFFGKPKPQDASSINDDSITSSPPRNVSIKPNNRIFLDGKSLLNKTEYIAYCVDQIKEISGLSDDEFERYYLPAMHNFAALCQNIGASERYHHAGDYGLLEHSLEVAMYAIGISRGLVYYPDKNIGFCRKM